MATEIEIHMDLKFELLYNIQGKALINHKHSDSHNDTIYPAHSLSC